jgi:predicted lipid-binding transport protein (Tim44 family)
MSRTWKWILGILAVVLVVAVAAAAVFVWRNHSTFAVANRFNRVAPNSQTAPGTPNAPAAPNNQQNPSMPYGFRQYRGYPYQGFERRMPMMGGRGFGNFGGMMPFGLGVFFLGGFFRLLIPLVILVLVALLFYQLGKRAGARPAPATPPTPPSTPTQLPTPPPGRKVADS